MSKVEKAGKPSVAPDQKSPAGNKTADVRFRKLIENSQDGITLLDRDLRVIYRSSSAERINGWNETERAKYSMDALIHPDDSLRVISLLNEVRASPGISKTCTFRSKHFAGHYIWLECIYTNHFNEPGIDGIVCNFRDVSQQKKDEEILRQTIKELFAYQYALDESAIVAITDQKGIIKHVNANFCKISKYSEAELIGQDHRIINSGYHDKAFIRNLWVTIAKGEIWKGELKNKAKDGSYYWVDTTIVPFLNEHGKPYQYLAIRSDITERKLNEGKIIESERFTKTVTDNMPALIAYFNSDVDCLFANKPYMEWFEKQPHEILGVNKRDILDKEEFELHETHIREVLKGKPQRFERTFHKADGKAIDTDTQYLPDIDRNKVKGFYSLIYDITEIKRAEKVLLDSERKYRNLFESNPAPLLLWDLETTYCLDCNPAAMSKYGYTRDEFLKLKINDMWVKQDESVLMSDIISAIEWNGTFKKIRRHQKKDGSIIYVDINAQFIDFNDKKVLLAMVFDVTESHYYNELDKLEKDLLEKCTRNDSVLPEILNEYLTGMEALHIGMRCSILENRGGRLFNLSSPNLPARYISAIEGTKIAENLGPCSLAAARKQKIMARDIQCAKFSVKYKKAAALSGLKACWSHPIIDSTNEVIATFACFYKDEKEPSDLEQNTISRAINILQLILESNKREQALRASNARFEKATEATFDVIWEWDLDTNAVYYSENFKTIFGHDAGMYYDNLPFYLANVHPDDLGRALLDPEDIKYGDMANWFEEYRFKKADGEYAYVRDRAVVIRDENWVGIRMVGAIKDITRQKEEEHHLKLLESVITNTTDAVLITEAEPMDEPGPRIVYANEAFAKMTGYSASEVIGKTPRILQGPKSDIVELKKLSDCMRAREACETTVINYKKSGEEFWINLAVSPVINNQNVCTHFIAIERDVTERKNEELLKAFLTEITRVFNETDELNNSLLKVLGLLAEFGNFSMAEAWLIGADRNKVNLMARFIGTKAMKAFYDETADIRSFAKDSNIPDVSVQLPPFIFWHHNDTKKMLRDETVRKAGLKTAYIVPLKYNNEVIGTLLLGSEGEEKAGALVTNLLEMFGTRFGADIKRRQVEQELNQIFNFTPDILCIANTDGYFKKVNPAMCAILEYNDGELLSRPFMQFVDPRDYEKTATELQNIAAGNPSYYIENRYITKSGKVKWLAWTTTAASDQGALYCAAKDITEKKELEDLFGKATTLARIGSWEVDVVNETVFWSDITREIHESEPGYHPDIQSAINFYKKGLNREIIVKTMENAIINGVPGDVELQIVTAKRNIKWVRVIVEAEFAGGKCKRVYGSLQDIDVRKKAEIASKEALEERNTILESIADAFFAVDRNWVVTYWNNMAEKVLMTPTEKILNHNLWEVFSGSIDSISYQQYHEAVAMNHAAHFEDYFEPLNKWYEISAYPSATGLSVYFKDITDRKLSETLLKELNANLQKQAKALAISNAELEQFAYVASHDLQEPLRMVTSFMTQLEKKYGDVVDDRGRQYIHFAVDGAKRMRQIILDLLDFSRVGSTEDDIEDVDFNKLMAEMLALYRRQIEEERANITFENLPVIHTYKTPMRQVFQNLVGNSLKYHKPGEPPVIEISCVETASQFQFAVKDYGIGIAPEYWDKIFIIFQRLHNKDEYSGTGMGLAIAKKIIENMGGKIWVESEEGNGSTFYFTLLKNNRS